MESDAAAPTATGARRPSFARLVWAPRLAACQLHPGRWMAVDPPYASKGAAGVQASHVRGGHLAKMLPGGHWQCVIWPVADGGADWDLFVRWNGPRLEQMPEGLRASRVVLWQEPPAEALLRRRERRLLPLLARPGEWQTVTELGSPRSVFSTASMLRRTRHPFGTPGHCFEARAVGLRVEGRYLPG